MRRIMLFSVILLLFLAGCKETETGPTGATPFIGGTKALDIEFSDVTPSEIYDSPDEKTLSSFNINLQIENVGEYDVGAYSSAAGIQDLTVRLSGLYAADFKRQDGSTYTDAIPSDFVSYFPSEDELSGTKKDSEGNIIPGGIWFTTFPTLAYAKKLSGSITLPIRADVEYRYENKASVMYCLRRNLMSRMSGICEVTGAKTVYNSAGPVHVTSATENVAGKDKLMFIFKVKNVGDGRILSKDASSFSEKFDDKNKVYVIATTGLPKELKCSNLEQETITQDKAGYLRLSENGEGIFTCTLDTSGLDTEAVKELKITLIYTYIESLDKTLTVKHMLG